MIRELTRAVRAARDARDATRHATVAVLAAVPSPYVVHLRDALEQLGDAHAHERLVLEQHKPP